MERIEEFCNYYISFLRSLAILHQNNHWRTRGHNFYGNHLLFDKLYHAAADNSDLAAEKFIGVFSDDVLELPLHYEYMHKILKQFSNGNPVETSLAAEKKFLEISKKLYDALKEAGKLTLGCDDMIMSIASKSEEAVYLLGQVEKTANKQELKTATRKLFLKRLVR